MKNHFAQHTQFLFAATLLTLMACQKNSGTTDSYTAIKTTFGTKIDPANLANYANQTKPTYILKDNTAGNTITNAKATLGRVLFYDKQLSIRSTERAHRSTFDAFD
jgi:cytochrome c peroxidase